MVLVVTLFFLTCISKEWATSQVKPKKAHFSVGRSPVMDQTKSPYWSIVRCRHLVSLNEKHAASTHLHEIKTGEQADTVFGQDPLLSRRHGQASSDRNRSNIWRRKNGWSLLAPCGDQERSMPLCVAGMRRTTAAPDTAQTTDTQTRAALSVCLWEAPGLVLCVSTDELSGRDRSHTDGEKRGRKRKGRRGRKRGAGAMGTTANDSAFHF